MSVLDERIRRIATEVSSGLADGLPGPSAEVAALRDEVAALTARVEELEKAPAPAPKRAPRKAPESSE